MATAQTKPTLTPAEKKDLNILSKESHIPVEELKKQSPAADVKPTEPVKPEQPEKSEQEIANEEFSNKLSELAAQISRLATTSDHVERIEKVVHDALKARHQSNYQ